MVHFYANFVFIIHWSILQRKFQRLYSKRIQEANDYSFSGVVYEKKIEGGEGYRFPHYLFLDTGIKWKVNSLLYDRIEIGDSVVKKNKSDSVFYYIKKNNQTIIEDENFYLREKYLSKLKQNNLN